MIYLTDCGRAPADLGAGTCTGQTGESRRRGAGTWPLAPSRGEWM